MKILSQYDPADKAGWLKLRLQGLGGSDAAAIMGADPWRSSYDVYQDRVANEAVEAEFNESAHWGNVLEDIVAKEFATRNNLQLRSINVVYQHDWYPWMLATIDRMIVGEYGELVSFLEVKTRSAYAQHDWENGVPRKVYWQCQHYLAVTGFEECHVAVLIGGQKFSSYVVVRNDFDISELIGQELILWDQIVTKEPPPITASVASNERMDAILADPNLTHVLTYDSYQDLAVLKSIMHDLKELEHAKDTIILRIKEQLGSAVVGLWDGEPVVKWSPVITTRLNTKAMKASGLFNVALADFEVETATRVFKLMGTMIRGD